MKIRILENDVATGSKTKMANLDLANEFDAHEVENYRSLLDELAEAELDVVNLDCSNMRFIDSSGIGAIVYLYKRLKRRNSQLTLSGVSGQPLKLMTMLRVNQTIPFIEQAA